MRLHQLPLATWALVLSIIITLCIAAPAAEQKDAAQKAKPKKAKKPPAPPIGQQLTLQDFDETIKDNYWFIEFYSPTCPHCRKFAPTWKAFVASSIKDTPRLHFAQVNCIVQGDLCAAHDVKGYPELNFFYNGVRLAQFNEDRLQPLMTKFVQDNIKRNEASLAAPPPKSSDTPKIPAGAADPAKRPAFVPAGKPNDEAPAASPSPKLEVPAPPPPADAQKPVVAAVKEASALEVVSRANPDGAVLPLVFGNFQHALSEGPVFVKFFAPWCGHCKKLAPIWEDVANNMKGKLTIAEVDCDAQGSLCKQQGVEGYPQLFFFSGGKRLEYIGKRAFTDLVSYANKAMLPAAVPIALPALEEALKTQEVFFLLDYPAGSPKYAKTVEAAAKVLVGTPSVYHSTDDRITKKYGSGTPPVLMVFKDGTLHDQIALDSSSSSDRISDWFLANRLPLAQELSPENFAHVMKNPGKPLVVLAAVDPGSSTIASDRDNVLTAARRWRQRATELSSQNAGRVPVRDVVFVWMDGVQWAKWLKSMYGITALPQVVVVDHSKLIYANTDASGQTIDLQPNDMLEAVNDALRGVTRWKHSDNIAERWVRYLNESLEVGMKTVFQNWTTSLVVLVLAFVLVYLGFRRCTRDDTYRSVYVPQHHGRLD